MAHSQRPTTKPKITGSGYHAHGPCQGQSEDFDSPVSRNSVAIARFLAFLRSEPSLENVRHWLAEHVTDFNQPIHDLLVTAFAIEECRSGRRA